MKMPSRIFPVYFALITFLGMWAARVTMDKQRQAEQYAHVASTVKLAREAIERNNQELLRPIERNCRDWQGTFNCDIQKQSQAALLRLDTAHQIQWEGRADSLVPARRRDQRDLLLACIGLDSVAAVNQTLADLSKKSRRWIWDIDRYMPMIQCEKACYRAGEVVKGQVYWGAYCSVDSTEVNLLVNDRPVPVVDGIGQFKQVCRLPGEKKYKVVFVQKDSKGSAWPYRVTKEFSTPVCQ